MESDLCFSEDNPVAAQVRDGAMSSTGNHTHEELQVVLHGFIHWSER
ncbi:hypothetical protein NTE_00324 [Candidatus Nitrososphaera evergladensis SR1]|uniref:Uncharacterized protein n=1 Tax=Candidatus Nitrososphaera evergladensis SR1 TaxID=1459636 RepID=A0A075MLP2_9ARCH|nr:hypothetical protein NTE_00324 [Candidatus Nitrososphaera evergladensis SR1]